MTRTIVRVALLAATVTLCGGAPTGASPAFAVGHTSATAVQSGTPSTYLRVGSRGEAVRAWQLDVNLLSSLAPGVPSVDVDGIFGSQTASATRDVQRFTKVAVDGIVGPQTRAAMDGAIHRVPAAAGGPRSWRGSPTSRGLDSSSRTPMAEVASAASAVRVQAICVRSSGAPGSNSRSWLTWTTPRPAARRPGR